MSSYTQVFQRRLDSSVGFYRGWEGYKEGFGNINSEYWLGNEKLFYLTAQGDYELRVDLEDFEGETRYALYDKFRVGDETTFYKLMLGSYSGNAGKLDYANTVNQRRRRIFFLELTIRGGWIISDVSS